MDGDTGGRKRNAFGAFDVDAIGWGGALIDEGWVLTEFESLFEFAFERGEGEGRVGAAEVDAGSRFPVFVVIAFSSPSGIVEWVAVVGCEG